MATVGCAGILVADMFCGPMSALPEPGQLLTVDDMPTSVGGCAANVAIDVARQGIDVEVAGCLGHDAAAEQVVSSLRHAGVGCDHIARVNRAPTSKTVILLVAGQDRRYIHSIGANGVFCATDIHPHWACGLKALYLGGLFAMPGMVADELATLLETCRRAGVLTIGDVVVPSGFRDAGVLVRLLPHFVYFLPNDDEARVFTGASDPLDQIAALQARGANTVIVTCGPRGSFAGDKRRRWRAGAHRCDAIDPSGSGDAFAAGVITGIVHGWDLPRTLTYGSALGASAVRSVGTTESVFRSGQAEAFIAANPIEVEEVP